MKLAGALFFGLYRAVAALLVAAAAAVLLLLLFGVRPYAVVTGSMEPTIPQGCVCFVNQRASFAQLREGDIIVFRLGDLLVTHRAVQIDGEGVTTKGDANSSPDTAGKVTEENYVGSVLFWLPFVGTVLLYARTGAGRFVVLGAFAAFLAAGLLYDALAARKAQGSK
ncbi:MAG: signal peptidase I [Oscillospiraceae bacterium]|nr:signal peptidase I [Oscillospiraceae bacterium]